MRKFFILMLSLLISINSFDTHVIASDQIPLAAPMTTDLAGSSESTALPSVYRIFCTSKAKSGTGFLHKSGNVITAAHVISECAPKDILIVSKNEKIRVSKFKSDAIMDLALLYPESRINQKSLHLSESDRIKVGSQVSTWGFPEGFTGIFPLLTSGYISGYDSVSRPNNKKVPVLVVNAAFNSGNSGGPLVSIEDSSVIGVVSSKLAPLPRYIEIALEVLKQQKIGVMYEKTKADGSKETISEATVIGEVLQYLRGQTQLVIGHAVLLKDLKDFLTKNGIEP